MEARTEALAAAQFCYTSQVNAIKAKLQSTPYYCASATWTYDGWNLRNSDCSSTSAYSLWVSLSRNSAGTCAFYVNRLDDDGDPPTYCRWKAGTVNTSNQVTITNYAGSCW